MTSVDFLDGLIDRLAAVRTQARQSRVQLAPEEIVMVLDQSRAALLAEPSLLEISAPVTIAGDTHGQFYDVLSMFDKVGYPPSTRYLMLGDYVNRGRHGIECMVLMLALKLRFPEHMFLLRGNHETKSITRIYGFYDECKRRYSIKLWKGFVAVFDCLPVAALVAGKIFCVHGGLSPELTSFDKIRNLARPTDVLDTGLLCDLLWADPDLDVKGRFDSVSHSVTESFGIAAVEWALDTLDIDLICRAHQVVENGYEFFGSDRSLVTIFSAPNYCGEFDNKGAVMHVSAELMCNFTILHGWTASCRLPSSQLKTSDGLQADGSDVLP